ncbi:MAG: RIP metalloprotease RseP [Candidatus Magasanikbacteria bacterium]|nr:RIP metalloprotease RseP [Candidatus Magasanikbacteria bacterium]
MASLLYFLAVLAILVVSHEFGHFIFAKKTGMGVHEFGFGFPPRFLGIQFKKNNKKQWRLVWGNRDLNESDEEYGTVYSLNWLPLGGFVKIKGENGEEASDPDSFAAKKFWQKSLVLCAGVLMNILLAFVLLTAGYVIGLPQNVDSMTDVSRVSDRRIEILQILPRKPAEAAGIQAGDVILQVGDLQNPRLKQMQEYIDAHKNEQLLVRVKRNDQIIEKKIQPVVYNDTGKGGIGVAIAEVGTVRYPFFSAIWQGVKTTIFYLKEIIVAFYLLLKGLFAGNGVGEAVSGPVGVAVMTGRVAKLGWIYLIQFAAMLSLNLAVFNILPIPALDGGRQLFLIIAKLRGKPVSQKLEQIFHTIGFALLMLLVLVVTVRDIANFRAVIWSFIKHLL